MRGPASWYGDAVHCGHDRVNLRSANIRACNRRHDLIAVAPVKDFVPNDHRGPIRSWRLGLKNILAWRPAFWIELISEYLERTVAAAAIDERHKRGSHAP